MRALVGALCGLLMVGCAEDKTDSGYPFEEVSGGTCADPIDDADLDVIPIGWSVSLAERLDALEAPASGTLVLDNPPAGEAAEHALTFELRTYAERGVRVAASEDEAGDCVDHVALDARLSISAPGVLELNPSAGFMSVFANGQVIFTGGAGLDGLSGTASSTGDTRMHGLDLRLAGATDEGATTTPPTWQGTLEFASDPVNYTYSSPAVWSEPLATFTAEAAR